MKKRPLLLLFLLTGVILLSVNSALCQEMATDVSKGIFSRQIDTIKKIMDILAEFVVKYSLQVLGGIVILVIGFIISRIAVKAFVQFLERRKVDVTVIKFLAYILKLGILIFTVLVALGNFGITVAPFIAGISVAGFGLSFALQGPLSNYAAGASLIFTKPFKIGDIIEVTSVMGEVEDMTLARTVVVTVDGTKIIIPNKQIIGEIIHNYTMFKKLDIKVGVSYDSEVEKALGVLTKIIKDDKRVSDKLQVKIGISEFADSSINLYARIWCKQIDYWDLLFAINKAIYKSFKQENIQIPFPQRDVHIAYSPSTPAASSS